MHPDDYRLMLERNTIHPAIQLWYKTDSGVIPVFYKGQQNDITYVNRVKGYGFNDKNGTELYSYLNDDDIIAIGKMMSCLMGSTCLLPLPITYMNNGELAIDNQLNTEDIYPSLW